MPTAAFTTLGCKVNQYETQRILESFEDAGFDVVPFESPADVYVVNTCSVTSIAESKSRYTLRRALRQNPNAKMVVTGCAGQMALNHGHEIPGADLVVPNPDKLRTLEFVREAMPELFVGPRKIQTPKSEICNLQSETPNPKSQIQNLKSARTRATLKIQDGCSVMCSYCSIPFTRPGLVSRPADEVIAEAIQMVENGYREIVLTGVLIGAYGPETGSGGPDFEELIERIHEAVVAGCIVPASTASRAQDIPAPRELSQPSVAAGCIVPASPASRAQGIPAPRDASGVRLRISSIELRQVTPRVMSLIERGIVVPHLHIPLQAGSDRVLADMNRPYRQADYLDVCATLKRRIPGISITTDIMVGFPTETDADFDETRRVCEEVGYLKIHSFRFSPRLGTPADAMGDPVSPEIKQARSAALQSLSNRLAEKRAQAALGQTLRVLVEGKVRADGLLEGLSDDYLTVQFAGPLSLARGFAHVRVEEARGSVLFGELAAAPSARISLRVAG